MVVVLELEERHWEVDLLELFRLGLLIAGMREVEVEGWSAGGGSEGCMFGEGKGKRRWRVVFVWGLYRCLKLT